MFRKNLIKGVTVAACIVYVLLLTTHFSFPSGSDTDEYSYSVSYPDRDTAFGGVFYRPHVNDSLPYYRYKHIEDSIRQITERIKYKNEEIRRIIFYIGAFGIGRIKDEPFMDTDFIADSIVRKLSDSSFLLSQKLMNLQGADSMTAIRNLLDDIDLRRRLRYNELRRQQGEKKETPYYLILNGYKKKNHLTEFFRDKGTNNLAYFVADSSREGMQSGHFERRQIAVRYATNDQRVLVPLTKYQYWAAWVVCCIAGCCVIFLPIYILIALPIQIVTSISEGRAFTFQNIRRFRLIGIGLVVLSLIALFTPYLLWLFFHHIIPDELGLKPFWEILLQQLPWMLGALGAFLIGKAFEKGYKLQQENTLTI